MSNPVLISCSFHLTIAADGTEFPADWDELSEVGRLIFEHLFYFLCSMLLKMLKVFQKVSRHIPSRQKVWKWPQRQTNLVRVVLANFYHHILCNWIAFTYWTWPLRKPFYAKDVLRKKTDNALKWQTGSSWVDFKQPIEDIIMWRGWIDLLQKGNKLEN